MLVTRWSALAFHLDQGQDQFVVVVVILFWRKFVKFVHMYTRPCHTNSDFSISQDIWSLYPTEWKSKFVAKSTKPIRPAISAQPALPWKPGRAAWAEIAGQNGLAYLATNLDYHSLGYRDHISCDIEKLEQFYFRLTGPSAISCARVWES